MFAFVVNLAPCSVVKWLIVLASHNLIRHLLVVHVISECLSAGKMVEKRLSTHKMEAVWQVTSMFISEMDVRNKYYIAKCAE